MAIRFGQLLLPKVGTKIELLAVSTKRATSCWMSLTRAENRPESFKGIWKPESGRWSDLHRGNWSKPSSVKGSDKNCLFCPRRAHCFWRWSRVVAKQIKKTTRSLTTRFAVEYPQLTVPLIPTREGLTRRAKFSNEKIGVFKAEMTPPKRKKAW